MAEVLEVLFGSKSRARVMRFFVLNPEKDYDFTQVREKTQMKSVDVRKDINALVKIGMVKTRTRRGKKNYLLNENFSYYVELRDLFIKSNVYPLCTEVKNLKDVGRMKLILVSGVFLNYAKSQIDLLVVGDDISPAKLKSNVAAIEAEIGHEVRYMSLSMEDFHYRLEMMDRFMIEFLAGPHDTIVNKMPKLNRLISEIKN